MFLTFSKKWGSMCIGQWSQSIIIKVVNTEAIEISVPEYIARVIMAGFNIDPIRWWKRWRDQFLSSPPYLMPSSSERHLWIRLMKVSYQAYIFTTLTLSRAEFSSLWRLSLILC